MILSDVDILKVVNRSKLKIDPFIEKNVQPASIDVCLSEDIRTFNRAWVPEIDLKSDKDRSWPGVIPETGYRVSQGEFLLGSTIETFHIPKDMVARIEGKSSLGRLGLIVHATAGYIDPGFKGQITLEIFNLNHHPIRIYPGMKVAQISFHILFSPTKKGYGPGNKYQNQKGPTPSRYFENFKDGD